MSQATILVAPEQRTDRLMTVRRAIALGARAAATEQQVEVADATDHEGYCYKVLASETLESAIDALQEADGDVDLYALAVSVRKTLRLNKSGRRAYVQVSQGEERAHMCAFYRRMLSRWLPGDESTRRTARSILNTYEANRQARIEFAQAAGRA